MKNVISLGKLVGLWLLFCVDVHTKYTRNELARLVMGTIFLVLILALIPY